MLFDLDDTLLNRDKAVENMFLIILKKCYKDITDVMKNEMLQKFIESDKRSYGVDDKIKVLEALFDTFPPTYRLPRNDIRDFWNKHFPFCFSIDKKTIDIVNAIKHHVKIAMITNGSTERQKAKIRHTNLHSYFDIVIISEEVGLRKPDKRIFELALNKLDVRAEDTLFVGDDLEKDIAGCQNVNIKGIWFNPNKFMNTSKIKPYAEINTLDCLLGYITQGVVIRK